MIHYEKLDCRSADGSATHKQSTLPLEVLTPVILSRMEQPNDLASVGIDGRDVRPLVRIASITAQTEVLGFSLPTVLPRDNVVDVEREESVLVLMNATVLAAIARALADESP